MAFLSIIHEADAEAERLTERWRQQLTDIPAGKPRSRLARALLADLLQGGIGGAETYWNLKKEPSGRPILRCENDVPTPSVSMAHSGGWIACAFSKEGEIGVDLEVAHPHRDWRGIAEACFGPLEIGRVEQEGVDGFYRIWSLREAMAKATGHGLAQVTDRRDRAEHGPATGIWSRRFDESHWQLAHDRQDGEFNLAVAIRQDDGLTAGDRIELNWWRWPAKLQKMRFVESAH
ncbi:MAG: 4'-phosphopantetheinyl transferase superfamily protein [Dongiaceae bacterium]